MPVECTYHDWSPAGHLCLRGALPCLAIARNMRHGERCARAPCFAFASSASRTDRSTRRGTHLRLVSLDSCSVWIDTCIGSAHVKHPRQLNETLPNRHRHTVPGLKPAEYNYGLSTRISFYGVHSCDHRDEICVMTNHPARAYEV